MPPRGARGCLQDVPAPHLHLLLSGRGQAGRRRGAHAGDVRPCLFCDRAVPRDGPVSHWLFAIAHRVLLEASRKGLFDRRPEIEPATPALGRSTIPPVWTSRQPSRRSGHSIARRSCWSTTSATSGPRRRKLTGMEGPRSACVSSEDGDVCANWWRQRMSDERPIDSAASHAALPEVARAAIKRVRRLLWYSSRGSSCSRWPGRPSSRTRSISAPTTLPCLLRPAHRSTSLTSANIASARSTSASSRWWRKRTAPA